MANASVISIHALREEGDQRRSVHPKPIKISIHALREEGDRLARMLLLAKPISIHALREEGDTGHSLIAGDSAIFLSTPSARRATVFFQTHSWFFSYFYPRPPRGGRRAARVFAKSAMDFYPRPPRGGRLHRVVLLRRQKQISIHALREEGDVAADAELYVAEKFLSTPSARRATRRSEQSRHVSAYFYPRPPRGGRRLVLLISAGRIYFYPRPPRGGRPAPQPVVTFVNLFLSTPSARRATGCWQAPCWPHQYFYPRPPRGGRPSIIQPPMSVGSNFYPRPPRGGRPRPAPTKTRTVNFYPRPPRGGRPGGSAGDHHPLRNFYPRPPRGGRLSCCDRLTRASYFYPRPPRGGRL